MRWILAVVLALLVIIAAVICVQALTTGDSGRALRWGIAAGVALAGAIGMVISAEGFSWTEEGRSRLGPPEKEVLPDSAMTCNVFRKNVEAWIAKKQISLEQGVQALD